MPIKSMTITPAPGHLVQVCAGCGAEHTISFDRGAQKSRTGPFSLRPGDTLIVKVDAVAPVTVTFAPIDLPDFENVTAAVLAAKLNPALPGACARDDFGGLLLESAATDETSCLEITGGTARAALGFATDGSVDPCLSRPVLGISFGGGQIKDKNVLALGTCQRF